MGDSGLLDFTPVPLRARRDGWTVAKQRLFIEALARGLRPGTAARRLGLSRQTAYALRRRPGAEGFAAAWDAAVEMARRRRIAARPTSLYERAVEGVLHPIRYRRRVVAVERRFDNRALVRLLGQIDRQIGKR